MTAYINLTIYFPTFDEPAQAIEITLQYIVYCTCVLGVLA